MEEKNNLTLGVKKECPLEFWEQAQFFTWVYSNQIRVPELQLCNGSLNGVYLSPKIRSQIKGQGLRKGFPDIDIPIKRENVSGLKIELKRVKGGRVDTEQKRIHSLLVEQGFKVEVCHGWVEAVRVTCDYLGIDPGQSFEKHLA